MTFESFDQVNQALERYMPQVGDVGRALKLDRIEAILKDLGDPQNSYPVIHVAGTSGKTSTCYFAASLLLQTGAKVGLTVSPHLEQINERLQINSVPLPEADYCRYFTEFYSLLAQSTHRPTYFELLTAFAFWVFAREKVDFAVVEVGLGGLLDATNVVTRADKTCIITDIGFDHTHILGKTIAEIAAKKAGIIRPYNVVFMYEQGDEVMQVVREVCESQQAELHELWPLEAKELPQSLPVFQRRNWYLALSACQYVLEHNKWPELNERQLMASSGLAVPGRMEETQYHKRLVVIDGAHNLQKMETFFTSYRARYGKEKARVLFALAQHKSESLKAILDVIIPHAEHIVITSIDEQDSGVKRSTNPAKIAEQCHLMGFDDWEIVAEPKAALNALCKPKAKAYIVVGSLYLAGKIRPLTKH